MEHFLTFFVICRPRIRDNAPFSLTISAFLSFHFSPLHLPISTFSCILLYILYSPSLFIDDVRASVVDERTDADDGCPFIDDGGTFLRKPVVFYFFI